MSEVGQFRRANSVFRLEESCGQGREGHAVKREILPGIPGGSHGQLILYWLDILERDVEV